jgi:hypothetical protein
MTIKGKLAGQFEQVFGKTPPAEVEEFRPPHLRALAAQDVERIVRRIRAEWPAGLPYTLEQEVTAWAETKNAHDARRVERALRHCYRRVDLADEIQSLIGEEERR